jgi:hypothetical protein
MEKENKKGFMNFSAFRELKPLIVSAIDLADSLIDTNPKQNDLLMELKKNSVECMLYLVDGYNKYHSDEKATLYGKARSSVAKIQCLLILLSDVSVINIEQSNKLINDFETKMSLFGGLIRKMEDRLYA